MGDALAIEAIKRLKAAYFRTLDAKLWAEFAQLLTPDCEFITYRDPNNLQPKRRSGREEIVVSVRRTVGRASTSHKGHLLNIEIRCPVSAAAVWEMTDHTEISRGDSIRVIRGAGRYYEHYRLVGGCWMISRLELQRTALVIE